MTFEADPDNFPDTYELMMGSRMPEGHTFYDTFDDFSQDIASSQALIIIDMQEMFLDCLAARKRNHIIQNQRDVLDHCREYGVPVMVVQYFNCGPVVNEIQEKAMQCQAYTPIFKESDDAFEGTYLEKVLRKLDVQEVSLAGILASFCVRNTGEGALKRGFRVNTSFDLIANPYDYEGQRDMEEAQPWFDSFCSVYPSYLDLCGDMRYSEK